MWTSIDSLQRRKRLGKIQVCRETRSERRFIDSLTDFDSRVTVDVDFLLRKIPNTPEQGKEILEQLLKWIPAMTS